MLQQWQAVGNNVSIRLAQDLNLRSPVPETNALQQKSELKNCFTQNQSNFSAQNYVKSKIGHHSNLVRFFAQN